MVVHKCRKKSSAKHFAEEAREKGFSATVSKGKKNYMVYVKRKK